jgi:arylsulfatase A-like enzyme
MRLPRAAGPLAAAGLISAALLLARSDNSTFVSPSTDAPRLVVLVTIDALRADRLGMYGYTRETSPNIDAFARESIVVEDAIAQAPYTKASIASLFTGLYPTAHKTYTVSATVADAMDGEVEGALPLTDVLPPSVTTLAEALKVRGYRTAAFTTNPFLVSDFGFAQGFDTFEFVSAEDFAPADQVLARALRVIGSTARPLFLWVHLMEPHSPYTPDELSRRLLPPILPPRPIPPDVSVPPYLAERRSNDLRVYESLYDAEIRSVDTALGGFFDALRQRAAWNDTVVVLTADHGEQFLEHGELEHNTALYDELIRVPLIMRVPGIAPRHVSAQAQLVDVMPTLLAVAGASPIDGIHGQDLRPLLRGERVPQEPAFAERVGQQFAVRTREWKLISGPGENRELYALARDPGEQHSIAHAGRMAEMERLLARLLDAAIKSGSRIAGETAPVDAATKERLESLGYVQK